MQLEGVVARGNEREVGVAIQRLQRCMLAVRELGNLKMEVSSQLVDTVRIPLLQAQYISPWDTIVVPHYSGTSE